MRPRPTVHDLLRERLLQRAGLGAPPPQVDAAAQLRALYASEWSPRFEELMRNRLVMGGMRYGLLHAPGKKHYDRVASIRKRAQLYAESGNLEHLVDCANECLLEFEESRHPARHFGAADGDGAYHTQVVSSRA